MSSSPGKHGVVAVLQDGAGRHLYIRRALTLKRAPGWWCFPGGEVEPGESHAAAIEREMLEEVGLRVRALEKVFESISPNGEYQLHWLSVRLESGQVLPVPNPAEVAEIRWLTPHAALALDPMLPTLRDWLHKHLDR